MDRPYKEPCFVYNNVPIIQLKSDVSITVAYT